MQADTNVSCLPLLWELILPPHKFEEALERSKKAGLESVVIFEGTNERAYLHSVIALTAIFNRYIKLVHFDGKLLHIFLDNKFKQVDLQQVRRIFESRMYLPDAVLNDILREKQATFSTREQTTCEETGAPEVLETSFMGLTSWEGPVDYTEIRTQLESVGIVDLTTCCLVYEVEELHETRYAGTLDLDLETPLRDQSGNITTIDSLKRARALTGNPLLLRATIDKAVAYYQRSKYKAPVGRR